jgi:gamma-glutamyltranspeptidase/glutathione hydrolase
VLKDGLPILAISVAGGDLQDQVTLNLLLSFIEFGRMPDQAVTAPRFATTHHEDSFDPDAKRHRTFGEAGSIQMNESVAQDVRDELMRRGHQIEVKKGPIGDPVMLYVDPQNGEFLAAGDPTAGRHAAGL